MKEFSEDVYWFWKKIHDLLNAEILENLSF